MGGKVKRGSFLDKFLSLVYPETCPYCGKIIGNMELKCKKCENEIKYTFKTRKVYNEVECVSPFSYEGKVIEAIYKFKFKGYKRYSWNFAMEIAKTLELKFPNEKFDGVTAVPLHKKREKERGYNQATSLAEELAKLIGAPHKKILEKIKNNFPQHKIKTYKERAKNVNGVYRATCNCSEKQKNRIILCDDIITSGNTLMECVKILKKSGFNKILCVAIADVPKFRAKGE